jgi:hypothetical protein
LESCRKCPWTHAWSICCAVTCLCAG